jgi:hypothetical protein
MNIETVLGATILAAWAALLLWGLGQTALSARRGYTSSDYVVGLVTGCLSGVGFVLMFGPHDASLFGAGFLLALCGTFVIWFRQGPLSAAARFKSDEKLQTTALGIIEEMIRKELLTVCVAITDPPTSVSCRVQAAFVSKSATQEKITREILTGEPILGHGVELLLNKRFRLPTDKEAQQLRDAMGSRKWDG